MHALEKMLARASGQDEIASGQSVWARIDLAEVNDLYPQTLTAFAETGAKSVANTDRVAFVFDHYAPAPTVEAAATHAQMRAFAREYGIKHLFDVNAGVCHQVLVEAGLVRPGEIVIATDSHTTIHGALGAFGTGVGATDMAVLLATGAMWMRMPEIVEVAFTGRAPRGVYAKDVALKTLGLYGTDFANYKAIEFTGEWISDMGVSERMALCSMAVEMAAKTSYMEPNQAVLDYVQSVSGVQTEPVLTDPGFRYSDVFSVSIDEMEPQVACPSRVDHVVGVSTVVDEKMQQCFIGTCTGGRFEDFEIAAGILAGKRVHPGVRLLIGPSSSAILSRLVEAGYLQTFLDAGATVLTPGCGPCLGAHDGVMAAGEKCISASNRNFPGRMGSTQAGIFIASPATVAASAIEGKIADPRKYL